MGTVRGYRRGTWLPWVRRSTAGAAESASGVQHPRQQRADGECAELALRAPRDHMPVRAPFLPAALARAGPRRVGSVGSAPSARHVGGCMTKASSRGGAAAGLLRYSQRGPRARDVTKEYSRGHPILWGTVRGYRKGHIVGVGAAQHRRAAESASGVQRPQQQ